MHSASATIAIRRPDIGMGDAMQPLPVDSSSGLPQTRRGVSDDGNVSAPLVPSEPEIKWKLKEAMFEMPRVGEDFLGFSLLAELGKGAFGRVFIAQQGQLAGRLVALKVATGLFGESQTLAFTAPEEPGEGPPTRGDSAG